MGRSWMQGGDPQSNHIVDGKSNEGYELKHHG